MSRVMRRMITGRGYDGMLARITGSGRAEALPKLGATSLAPQQPQRVRIEHIEKIKLVAIQ